MHSQAVTVCFLIYVEKLAVCVLCVCVYARSEVTYRVKGDALDSCALLWQVCWSFLCMSTARPCLQQDMCVCMCVCVLSMHGELSAVVQLSFVCFSHWLNVLSE